MFHMCKEKREENKKIIMGTDLNLYGPDILFDTGVTA